MNTYYQIFLQELDGTDIKVVRKRFVGNKGRAYDDDMIKIPRITNLETLAIGLHEIGHIKMNHLKTKKPTYVIEYEAETYALAILRQYNLHLGETLEDYRKYRKKAKEYVKSHIDFKYSVPYRIKRWLNI